ncbi:MAG: hypothetical protein WBE68_11685 [Candidatus Nitrosopolaris sp.]
MDTKISIVFSFIAIAAAVLLFAAGPLVATYQVFAYGHGGYGGYGHGGYGGYGGYGNGGNGGYGGYGNGGNGHSMAPCGGGPYSIVNGQIICTQVNG